MTSANPSHIQPGWKILTDIRIEIQAGGDDRVPDEILRTLQRVSLLKAMPSNLPQLIASELAQKYYRLCAAANSGSILISILIPARLEGSPASDGSVVEPQPASQAPEKAWGFFVIDWKGSGKAPGEINLHVYIYEE